MRDVTRSALVSETPQRMFDLINDVPSYPQFVPWCTHAAVETRSEREIVATLVVKRGPLKLDFTTRNTLVPPSRIDMRLERGPFRKLEGHWSLTPVGEEGCRVSLQLSYEFSTRLPGALFDPLFEQTAASLVDAFVTRARALRAAEPSQ
jgi:ribosome-associated toxin RatA of RatAB toxin-antitoxin module